MADSCVRFMCVCTACMQKLAEKIFFSDIFPAHDEEKKRFSSQKLFEKKKNSPHMYFLHKMKHHMLWGIKARTHSVWCVIKHCTRVLDTSEHKQHAWKAEAMLCRHGT